MYVSSRFSYFSKSNFVRELVENKLPKFGVVIFSSDKAKNLCIDHFTETFFNEVWHEEV